MPRTDEIAAWLDDLLHADRYPDDRTGVLAGGERPVRRLGVALEPDPHLPGWVRDQRLDALLLHRAWGLDPMLIGPAMGVLAYHLPLDDRLTTGYNPRLARALGMTELEPLGTGDRVPPAMVGRLDRPSFTALLARAEAQFGLLEEVVAPPDPAAIVERLAVAASMDDRLVREAAALGAGAYLTGQLRMPARRAVAETGIGVLATGHRAAEAWGLRALAELLRERWEELEIRLHPSLSGWRDGAVAG